MGKNSKIEWTNHTFNPWWGCVRVSPACKYCYAEAWAKRVGQKVWGPDAPRRFFGDLHWEQPVKWNREAKDAGRRARVFCASMADVFEERSELDPWRDRLWALVEKTPCLDWLMLTKRPEHILELVPWTTNWPHNVWVGTTIESQEYSAERLPHLARVPAVIRFVSAEPLLSELSLSNWLGKSIDWVITGGESGPHARPSSPSWFRSLLIQCMQADVPFHFKQWGDWAPGQGINLAKLRRQEAQDGTIMVRIGKRAAGRIFDGETWDGLPKKVA